MGTRIPTAPKDLKAAGRRYWSAVVREFVLDAAQLITLAEACKCLDAATEADLVVKREGMTITGPGNRLFPHPATNIARDNRGLFLRLTKSLHLDLEPLADHAGRPGRSV